MMKKMMRLLGILLLGVIMVGGVTVQQKVSAADVIDEGNVKKAILVVSFGTTDTA
jgi:glutamate/tyrosine decarboxylase-like PLP-dependent enzyme